MKRYIEALIIAGVICLPVFARANMGDNEKLRDLVVHQIKKGTYRALLRGSKQFDFKRVSSKLIRKFDLFICLMFDPGYEENNFTVAIGKYDHKVYILTESIENFNKILSIEGVNINNAAKATIVAREAVMLTRPYYNRFVVLSSMLQLNRYTKRRIEVHIEPMELSYKQGVYVGKEYILFGRDLMKRVITVSTTGRVVFKDSLIAKDIAEPSMPQE